MKKASTILMEIARKRMYKWAEGTIDTGDGIHRCARGALLGYFGWKGKGDRWHTEDDPTFKKADEKVRTLLKSPLSTGSKYCTQYYGEQPLNKLCAYNNAGHRFAACAKFLERMGL